MANTFWEKDFLIMCSYMSQSADCFMHSGFLLHIISNYALRLYVVHRIRSAASPESWTVCRSTVRCAMRMVISMTSLREISLSSDSANRISPTCRTSLPSGLPSNFGNRKCFCGKVTKSLPRRCRTSRCRAVCHTDRGIYETGNNSNHI